MRPPPRSTLFPYTTLFRSVMDQRLRGLAEQLDAGLMSRREFVRRAAVVTGGTAAGRIHGDRKSTRLNSSHLGISYAVFCLKKKNVVTIALASSGYKSSRSR